MPDQPCLWMAAEIVSSVDRENPADAQLRDRLRFARALSPEQRRTVSEMVFAFFRWKGWLEPDAPPQTSVARALELQTRFDQTPASFSDQELMAKAVPGWIFQQQEVTPAWVRRLQEPPPLWLRPHRGEGRRVAELLGDCEFPLSGPAAEAILYRGEEDLFRTEEFHQGRFEIQDISSQAVGWICDPRPGSTWWDACAGEGGKLIHLSDLMENKGLIWASDPAEWRLKRLKRRAARAGAFNYRATLWRDPERLPTKTRFDGVLVDAPCSGVGTWQRNAHARWTLTEADVLELAALQRKLLALCSQQVKPGGKLVYSVCTLTRPETVEVKASFEAAHPEFAPLAVADPFQQGEPRSEFWFRPEVQGGNGMYVAVWQKS